jgi:hypothetical protein
MNERNRDSAGRFSKTEALPPLTRFVCFITEDEERGCWIWTGGRKSQMKYGAFAVKHGHVVSAHKWAYEFFREPIPAGMELDHLCRNPRCVHPWHLEAVTHAENLRRGRNHFREKTHCPQGHPYAGDNLYIRPSDGARLCRACRIK